ncbi:J domain-containing protein [Halolamina sediminis]|uniref:J domain-containing protein n=1 Tax=Halolamina sediminis TaxID=1480675 RepID=UPI0006B44504|nr:J domain-containing protein [Halolamina sediminis]
MFPAVSTGLPSWLVSGLLLGVAASVVVALVFALGERYIPDPDRSGQRVGGPGRQRAEIRAVFDAADEPFLEDYEIGTTTVAFYLPDRNVAITFDPRAYLRLVDGPTHVVLCEHEVPGATIGRRLPFDLGVDASERATGAGPRGGSRARAGGRGGPRAAATRGDPVGDAFEFLDLERDADADEVQTAYREQVKELHPDQGGSEEEFKRLQEAYSTAKEYAS